MFEGPETDRLQLRELVDRYSDDFARIDAQAWRETWIGDAQWHFLYRDRDNRLDIGWRFAERHFSSRELRL